MMSLYHAISFTGFPLSRLGLPSTARRPQEKPQSRTNSRKKAQKAQNDEPRMNADCRRYEARILVEVRLVRSGFTRLRYSSRFPIRVNPCSSAVSPSLPLVLFVPASTVPIEELA
jgi:hypothetical protein